MVVLRAGIFSGVFAAIGYVAKKITGVLMKRSLALLGVLAAAVLVAGCGKSYTVDGKKFKVKKDKIVETSYGSKSDAKYFYKKPRIEKNNTLYVIGAVDVPGDSSPTRCEVAADMQARAELAAELKTRISNELQYSAEGFNINASNLSQITNQLTKIEFMQGAFIDTRFWEKKIVQNGPDSYVKYTCYSRAAMPLSKFKENTDRLLKEHEGDVFSSDFRRKVDASWDEFFKPEEIKQDE